MTKLSPSCLIVGFLGNRGGMPSGILGLDPTPKSFSIRINKVQIILLHIFVKKSCSILKKKCIQASKS